MKAKDYKAYFRQLPAEVWPKALQKTKENIRFLESIYRTGGENNHFSPQFKDAAVRERTELCQMSSALHALLREQEATL